MARWSSSASEYVDKAPADAGKAVPLPEPALTWVARPGLVAGSPWPRATALLLYGLPALVCLAWAAAWLGLSEVLAPVAVALAASAWGWLNWRRSAASQEQEASPVATLSWLGPWPGLPAPRERRSKPTSTGARFERPGSSPERPAPGFQLDGKAVWPRLRLQWGPHVCLQCSDRHWVWLTLRDRQAGRALRVLLRTVSQPRPESTSQAAGRHAGGSADAMASCEAWDAALARRRAQAEADMDAARDDFPATAIMKYDSGTELEPRRPHG